MAKKPRTSRLADDDDDDLIELTPSEIAVEELRSKIDQFGGEGKALIYAVRMGKKVRRGDANATELLKDPEKYLGDHFGGEDYKVDFQTSEGDWARRGVEFYCDVATYGPPKTLASPSNGGGQGGLSPDVAALKGSIDQLVAKLDAKPAVDPIDGAIRLMERMKALTPAAAPSSDPMQVLSMEVLRRGLAGMEKIATGNGNITPVEQIGVDAAKEFMPLIRRYLERDLEGTHRKPGSNAGGNGSDGSADMLKKELLPQAAGALLILAQAKKEAKEGAVMILKSVPKEYDSQLHAIVKGSIVDEMILMKPDLLPFREWLDEVQRLLVAEFEDANAPALVPDA
jgi:hypothetical protein